MSLLQPSPLQHLDSAEDLLGALGRLEEFHHYRSLICVLSRNDEALGAFRMDLPSREAESLAALHVVGLVAATEADAVAVVAYAATATAPRTRFLRMLAKALSDAGYGLYGPLWVTERAWGFYGGPTGSARLSPQSYAHARPPGGICLSRTAAARAQRQRCTLALELLSQAGWPGPLDQSPAHWAERILAPGSPSDALLVQLAMLLREPNARDALWFELAFGQAGTLPLEPEQTAQTELVAAERAANLLGRGERSPERARLETVAERLDRLRQRSPAEAEPALLCLWAWALWASGQATSAMLVLNRAVRLDSSYPLAIELRDFVLGGNVPNWLLNGEGSAASRRTQADLG